MKQINPKHLKIIKGLPPVAKKGDKVAIDSEFYGQTKSKLHRPHGTFAFLGCSFDGETVYYITDSELIQEFFDRLGLAVWIFHHAKYDITQLRRFAPIPQRNKMWDTMLISQIQHSGYYDTFSLADEARRRLDLYVPKAVREQFSVVDGVGEFEGDSVIAKKDESVFPGTSQSQIEPFQLLTREQLEYSCADIVATWQVYQHQRAEIDETDLEIWKEIELPFLWTILSMSGVKLDSEKWIALAEHNLEIADGIQERYGHWETAQGKRPTKEVFVGVNLNSPKQVKDRFALSGLKLTSTDVEALEKIIADGFDEHEDVHIFASDMLNYRKYAKRASTYGKKFVDDYVESDGRIYGDIFQMGAQTGRTSSRSPNLQNQPHDFEYRDCFIADEGNVMIVADWGSQEPRVAAYLTQDARLIEILNSDKKLYSEIARDVFGKTITKQDVEYSHIKSTILGIFYGMSAYGLSKHLKISEEEAQDMIDLILETYPGIQDYINRQKKAGEYVQSIYGRKIWLNKYNNGWLRDALNYPIQSSAADAMKIAAYRFVDACDEEIYMHSPLRLLVHDEIVLEIEKGNEQWAKDTLERVMIEVANEMHDGIKGSVEIFSGASWGCKS